MEKPKYTLWIKQYAKRYWYLIVMLLVTSLGVVFLELISPLPLKFLADNVFGDYPPPSSLQGFSKQQLLLIGALGYVGIFTLQALYSSFHTIVARKFSQQMDKAIMQEASEAVVSIPYNADNRLDSGTYLYQITNQSQQMSEYLLGNLVMIAQSVLTLIGIIVVLAHINLSIMLITFATIPLLALCVLYFGNVLEKKANETERAHAKVYGFIVETLSRLRTVQAFVLARKRQTNLNALVTERNNKAMHQLYSVQSFEFSSQLIIFLGISIAIVLGGNSVFEGAMTFGALLIFISYTTDVFDQVSSVINSVGSMKEQAAALQQAYDTINNAKQLHNDSGILKESVKGKVEFKHAYFSHHNQTVLEDINLSIDPGNVVGIVGLSGSGKTTLINSLLRFISPDKGWVMVDDHNVTDYDINFLRENIALVEQEPDIFSLTVSENIALADQDRQHALPDIMSSAVIANSNEFIEKMADKYDTIITNDKLSGGQKQRLAIARTHFKSAPIVLMDEPTSALDRHSADIFANNIFNYFQNRTVIIITHDLSLLKRIPKIYVVKDHTVAPIEQYGGLEAYSKMVSSQQT